MSIVSCLRRYSISIVLSPKSFIPSSIRLLDAQLIKNRIKPDLGSACEFLTRVSHRDRPPGKGDFQVVEIRKNWCTHKYSNLGPSHSSIMLRAACLDKLGYTCYRFQILIRTRRESVTSNDIYWKRFSVRRNYTQSFIPYWRAICALKSSIISLILLEFPAMKNLKEGREWRSV